MQNQITKNNSHPKIPVNILRSLIYLRQIDPVQIAKMCFYSPESLYQLLNSESDIEVNTDAIASIMKAVGISIKSNGALCLNEEVVHFWTVDESERNGGIKSLFGKASLEDVYYELLAVVDFFFENGVEVTRMKKSSYNFFSSSTSSYFSLKSGNCYMTLHVSSGVLSDIIFDPGLLRKFYWNDNNAIAVVSSEDLENISSEAYPRIALIEQNQRSSNNLKWKALQELISSSTDSPGALNAAIDNLIASSQSNSFAKIESRSNEQATNSTSQLDNIEKKTDSTDSDDDVIPVSCFLSESSHSLRQSPASEVRTIVHMEDFARQVKKPQPLTK